MAVEHRPHQPDAQPNGGAALPIGLPVYTSDGRRIGRVKEADERCFRVDARFAFDYWLSMRAVAAVRRGRVLLGVEKSRVEEYLVDTDCLEDYEHLEPVAPGGVALGLGTAVS
jgi:hypothetical protein